MNDSIFSVRIRSNEKTLVSIGQYPVHENKITFLFGESGIGKSLVSKAVYGLLDPRELDIEMNGQPYDTHLASEWVRSVNASSFFVFQEPSSHLNPLQRISEQLSEGSLAACKDEDAVLKTLWDVQDLSAVQKLLPVYPKPYRPSGGEKQRFLIAMAFKKIEIMLKEAKPGVPTFFVFDEPTGSLDNRFRNIFLSRLFELYLKRPFTILIITHDYSIISEIVQRHPKFVPHVRFREFYRTHDIETAITDFSPQDYLGWLLSAKPVPMKQGSKEVLRVDSTFSVFGRSLGIYNDEKCTQPADLVVRKGELVFLKAGSGVGKTTLTKIVMGLYRADTFRMKLSGLDFDAAAPMETWQQKVWGKTAGMVFQHADESLNQEATVFETFRGLPLKNLLTRNTLKKELESLFDRDKITDAFLDKKVAYLSGGQKQRLNLLRTLIMDTDLVVLDEPLNGLDFASCKKVLDMMEHKQREGKALFLISHNEEIFDHIVDKRSVYYLSETPPPFPLSRPPSGVEGRERGERGVS
ncbi:MAG: ATP-binding cassette domain-containing protein [Fibrobacterota bacterium]